MNGDSFSPIGRFSVRLFAPRRCIIQFPSLGSKTPYTQRIIHVATWMLRIFASFSSRELFRERRALALYSRASSWLPTWKAHSARIASIKLCEATVFCESAIGSNSLRKPFCASSTVVIIRANLLSSAGDRSMSTQAEMEEQSLTI